MTTTVPYPADAPGPNAFLDAEGVWNQPFRTPDQFQGRPALFLDRDGVVIVEQNYLSDPDKVVLERGAADVITKANSLEIAAVLVTNQAGIGRGYYGWSEFSAVQDRVLSLLAAEGAHIDAVYACGHHADGIAPYQHPDHPARKPNAGMLRAAENQLKVDLQNSWIIGDRASDLGAGRNAGLAGGIHVMTGHGNHSERQKSMALKSETFSVIGAENIGQADTLPPLI